MVLSDSNFYLFIHLRLHAAFPIILLVIDTFIYFYHAQLSEH